MGEKTEISWTHHTFNPWWGCVKVSPGCDHCYAESDAKRYGHQVWGKDAPRRFFTDKHWNQPCLWNKHAELTGERERVFCASMADIGEVNSVLNDERNRLWRLIRESLFIDWQLLTKRPASLVNQLPDDWGNGWPQVWLGTTVESNGYRWRIDDILKAPAAVHWLSIEPQIGPVDLREYFERYQEPRHTIDWVIVGGESGGQARVFDLAWARDVIAVCKEYGVAVFNKQLGTVTAKTLGLNSWKGADPTEWDADLQIQEFPTATV